MAIGNPFDSYENDYLRQRQRYDAERAAFEYQNQLGLQNAIGRQLGAVRQADIQKPVPQPEPNKVLLLLGEEA